MTLPQPNERFNWVQAAGADALVSPGLAAVAPHLFTTRQWTLGLHRDAVADAGCWEPVASAIGVDLSKLARVRQVHGAGVVVAADPLPAPQDSDIVISGDSRVAIAVQSADCVPILIADRRTGAVAAAHAGWRGLAAGVPTVAIRAMRDHFGSRSEDLIAAIGPAIGACCYQVGSDVRDAFSERGYPKPFIDRMFVDAPLDDVRNPRLDALSSNPIPGRWFFDTWWAARNQLLEAGVPPGQVLTAELCTASHPDVLCSYRRDGAPAGRMVAVIRCAPRRP